MAELERRLQALATDAFPPAPDVSVIVAARVAAGELPPRARVGGPRVTRRRALALVLALVLLPAGAVAAVPSARHAVLDWLGLQHVRVERVPRLPQRSEPDRLDLGRRVASVQAASRAAGFAVEAPHALGSPDAVHVARDGVVSLAYEPRPGLDRDRDTGLGLLVTELRALQRLEYVMKGVGPGTRVEEVRVGGVPGVFLSGESHAVTIERPGDGISQLAPRLAGNTLVFERDGLVIRLEGHFGRRRALALARSVRPG